MVQFDVLLKISASHIVNIAEMKVTCHVNGYLLMNTDCPETNGLAFILKLLEIDL